MKDGGAKSGITLRSLAAILLGLVLVAIISQFVGVTAGRGGWKMGSEALPQPVLAVLVVMGAIGALVLLAGKIRLLTKAEMLCVAYALLLAAPLMSLGFWRSFLSSAATIGKFGEYQKYDLVSQKMLPYGKDLLANSWGTDAAELIGNVSWEEREVRPGETRTVAVLTNDSAEETSAVRFRVPVRDGEELLLPLNEHYLFLYLVRAEDLGPRSSYAVRLYYDDATEPSNRVVSSRQPAKKTAVQPLGFVRSGSYGIILPPDLSESVTVEFALTGRGEVELADLIMRDAIAIERAYAGKKLATPETIDQIPPEQRASVVVRPDNLLSPAGVAYVANAFTDWSAWTNPLIFWGGFYVIILAATFAMACIFRRQWMQNERFPLPMAKAPIAFTGGAEVEEGQPSLWRNPMTWAGFCIVFFWSLLLVLNAYDPGIPAFNVDFSLKSYFSDPAGQKAFGVNFTLKGLIFAIGLLMELNVVMSLVIGFFAFRVQLWFGEKQGFTSNVKFPYAGAQQLGAVLVYGGLILFTMRRYLGSFGKQVIKGGNPDGEALSPRISAGVLVASFAAMAWWAVWAGLPVGQILLVFAAILLFALVAARFRTECGTPGSEFYSLPKYGGGSPIGVFLLILGLVTTVDLETRLFISLLVGMMLTTAFWVLPGLQFELVEFSHRFKMRRWHVPAAAAIGVFGGIFVGGWVYLGGAYAIGADNFPIVGNFGSQSNYFESLNAILASESVTPDDAELIGSQRGIAFGFGAAVTGILFVLRMLFAGFWFHPMGFIVGGSGMMSAAWSSLLLAWLVRFTVLKFGGAAAVRTKLTPFAIGCLAGIGAIVLVYTFILGYHHFFAPYDTKFDGTF